MVMSGNQNYICKVLCAISNIFKTYIPQKIWFDVDKDIMKVMSVTEMIFPSDVESDVRYFRDFRHHWAKVKLMQLRTIIIKWRSSFKVKPYLFIYESKEDFSYNMSISDQQDNVFSGSYNFVDMPDILGTFNTVTFFISFIEMSKCSLLLSFKNSFGGGS